MMLAGLITLLKVKECWKQVTITLEGLGTEYEKCYSGRVGKGSNLIVFMIYTP